MPAWRRYGAHVVSQIMQDETLLVDLQSGTYHRIAGAGVLMWDGVDKGLTRDQILKSLSEKYDAHPEVLNKELTKFIDNLVAEDLIKPYGGTVDADSSQPLHIENSRVPFVPATFIKVQSLDESLETVVRRISWELATGQVLCESENPNKVDIVDSQLGATYTITGSGVTILSLVNSGLSRDELYERLGAMFDVPTAQLRAETDDFINRLLRFKLIQPRDTRKTAGGKPAMTLAMGDEMTHADCKMPFTPPAVSLDRNRQAALSRVTDKVGWEPSTPHVVAQEFDDEIIVVDLQAGIYFSIRGCGTEIWIGLANGLRRSQLLVSLNSIYEIDAEHAGTELDEFVGRLAGFGLIRPRETEARSDETVCPPLSAKKVFEPPIMAIHRDMEDVLRLDPIHDFDQTGWPNTI